MAVSTNCAGDHVRSEVHGGGDVEKWQPASLDVTSVMASLEETNVAHSGLSSLAEVGKGDGGGVEKMGQTVTKNLKPMPTEMTN